MSQLRERWEGVSLPGEYLLERWVNGDDDAGFFEASRGESEGPAAEHFTIKVLPQSHADASAQLALWERTKDLEHPNLRRLVDFGRAELDGQIVLYAVMEKADDTLASALSQGPLSETEAREVLDAVLSALRYLQSKGFAPDALDPDHVVAVGDRIELCTHGLKEAPVDAPFRHELRAFWDSVSPSPTLRRKAVLSEALGEVPEPVEVMPSLPVPPLPARGPVTSTTGSQLSDSPRAADAVPFPADENPRAGGGVPKWIFVGAAAVVLLVLGLNLRHSDSPAQAGSPLPTPVSTTIVPRKEPVGNQAPAASVAANGTKPSPLDTAPRAASGKAMWRVIAFTYRSHAAAEKKAEQVNRAHPELAAKVFSPRERKGYYLVALGGRMTHDDAVRLQRKARADRVTRDAYVQNYLD